MKIVSIDLETTGLHPEKGDQILQFGAVFIDDASPEYKCHKFERIIVHERITGSPTALAMNARYIAKIRDAWEQRDKYPTDILNEVIYPGIMCSMEHLAHQFATWLDDVDAWVTPYAESPKYKKINVIGKNYTTFDRRFLNEVPDWVRLITTGHKMLDIASVYCRPTDIDVPNFNECMKRAGMVDAECMHDAVSDANDVAMMWWLHANKNK